MKFTEISPEFDRRVEKLFDFLGELAPDFNDAFDVILNVLVIMTLRTPDPSKSMDRICKALKAGLEANTARTHTPQ